MAKDDMASVEHALEELETMLETMSGEGVTLEQSIDLYAKSADLIAKTNKTLAKAQVQIKEIDEKMEQLRLNDDI